MPPTAVATIQHDAVRAMTQLCQNFAQSEISISDENTWLLPSFVQTVVKGMCLHLTQHTFSRSNPACWISQTEQVSHCHFHHFFDITFKISRDFINCEHPYSVLQMKLQ